ncbi:MAG: OmpA family protein [Pseudomonadota bacterium]
MQSKRIRLTVLAVAMASLHAHAFADPYDSSSQANSTQNSADPCAKKTAQATGAIVGALLGGFLGSKIGKGNGNKLATVAGALGGLALGNYIGSEIDRRKCEVSKIAKKNNLEVVITDLSSPPVPDMESDRSRPAPDDRQQRAAPEERVGMSLSIEDRPSEPDVKSVAGGDALGNAGSSTQFESGSAVLSGKAEGYFREIAAQYALPFRGDALPQGASNEQAKAVQGLRQKRILVLGHTDDTGSSRLNADLSEHRARNVARLFGEAGVPVSQIYYQGSGETQPIADNRSEPGRAKNRRVEIVDLTDEAAFQIYLSNRKTNARFYRVPLSAAPELAVATPEPEPVPAKSESKSKIVRHSAPPIKPPSKGSPNPATPAVPNSGVAIAESNGYDFGGKPAAGQVAMLDIGKLVTPRSTFNFISPAMADDMPVTRACSEDRPRFSNAVKTLQNNQEYHVSEYLPNLYDTSWTDRVNGNLVALTHVAVLRDGAAPVRKPTVLIFKASRGKLDANSKADYSTVAEVNTYQGETGLLYRVFLDGPIKCLDVILARDHPVQASNSNLYYQSGRTQMVAAFNPKIAK